MARLSSRQILAASLWATLALGCDVGPTISAGRQAIIGGTTSTDASLSAVGALVTTATPSYGVICSGTLISQRMVLTAAHCFDSLPAGTPLGFFYGQSLSAPDPDRQTVPVASIHVHPGYPGGSPPTSLASFDDIAVVRLGKDLATVDPIALVRPAAEVTQLVKAGGGVMIAGFGQTDPSSKISKGVRTSGVTTIGQVGTHEIFLEAGTAAPQKCVGDSGGPTLGDLDPGAGFTWRLIGAASRAGQGCSGGSIESRVDVHLTWVHSKGEIPCGSGLSKDCPTSPPPPDKTIGEPCAADAECAGLLCVQLAAGAVCSQTCSASPDDCPFGFSCQSIQPAGTAAPIAVCLAQTPPVKLGPGQTCQQAGDCESAICAAMSGQRFCTTICRDDGDCPAQMRCTVAVGGSLACVPVGLLDPGDDGGGCAVGGPARPALAPLALGLPLLLALALLALPTSRALRRPGRW